MRTYEGPAYRSPVDSPIDRAALAHVGVEIVAVREASEGDVRTADAPELPALALVFGGYHTGHLLIVTRDGNSIHCVGVGEKTPSGDPIYVVRAEVTLRVNADPQHELSREPSIDFEVADPRQVIRVPLR